MTLGKLEQHKGPPLRLLRQQRLHNFSATLQSHSLESHVPSAFVASLKTHGIKHRPQKCDHTHGPSCGHTHAANAVIASTNAMYAIVQAIHLRAGVSSIGTTIGSIRFAFGGRSCCEYRNLHRFHPPKCGATGSTTVQPIAPSMSTRRAEFGSAKPPSIGRRPQALKSAPQNTGWRPARCPTPASSQSFVYSPENLHAA